MEGEYPHTCVKIHKRWSQVIHGQWMREDHLMNLESSWLNIGIHNKQNLKHYSKE